MNGDSIKITREYFDSILFEMRHIDSVKADTKVNFFGYDFSTPIATAALSHLGNTAENGMVKMAEGTKLANALCFSGMGDAKEIEDMCRTGAKVIKIIKPHADNNDVIQEIRDAEKAGAIGVGMDIDHAFSWNGEYDCVCGQNMKPKSLDEMRYFISETKLPFVIKGVLSVSDAEKSLDAGASGIIVSHHHGILDYAVPPLMILPEIVKEVDGRIPVFVDCCIESGMDAFKALALGADGVCTGRAIMEPLKNDGANGVAETIRIMNCKLMYAMERTGFARLDDINDSVIHMRRF